MVLIIFKSENCSYTGDPPTIYFTIILLEIIFLSYDFQQHLLNCITQ